MLDKRFYTYPVFIVIFFIANTSAATPIDSDTDNMPDFWENQYGLNPFDASDANQNNDNDTLDNITEYLHGGNPVFHDASNTPSYFVYWDSFNNYWDDRSVDASWQAHSTADMATQQLIASDIQSTDVVYSGNYSLKMQQDRWLFLNLIRKNIDVSSYQALEFYVHGGDIGGQAISVALGGSSLLDTPQLAAVNVTDYISGGNISPNTWHKVTIPLSDLLAGETVISRLNIGWPLTNGQTSYYLDAIRLIPKTAPTNNTITVDANVAITTLSKELLGSNGGYWMTNMQADGIVEQTNEAGISLMRYPGGSLSDSFHLQDWNHDNVDDFITTPDEYLAFLSKSGNTGMITTNFGTGTAAEAADFVYYANIDNEADIPYWEVGNEIYGDWENSWTHDGTEYMLGDGSHDGANDFCSQMKAVDSTIKVAMVGTNQASEANAFASNAISHATDCFDYYSLHYYPQANGTKDYHGLLSSPIADIGIIEQNISGMLSQNPLTQNVELAMTEYNSYFVNPESLTVEAVNMLFVADVIGQAAHHGIGITNYWYLGVTPTSLPDTRYALLQDYLSLSRQPTYFAFPLWSMMGDTLIDNQSSNAATDVSVYASQHSDNDTVTLLVINKTGELQNTDITINNFVAESSAQIYVASANSLNATRVSFNGNSTPPQNLSTVTPITMPVSNNRLNYSFEPYSVTTITIAKNLIVEPIIYYAETSADATVTVKAIRKAKAKTQNKQKIWASAEATATVTASATAKARAKTQERADEKALNKALHKAQRKAKRKAKAKAKRKAKLKAKQIAQDMAAAIDNA